MDAKFEVKKSGLKPALAHVMAGVVILGLVAVTWKVAQWTRRWS